MRAPGDFVVTITGNVHRVMQGAAADEGRQLAYILYRLLTDRPVHADSLSSMG